MDSTTVEHTFHNVKDPSREAERFRFLLASERGFSSRVEDITGGVRVVASDGRAVDFLRE